MSLRLGLRLSGLRLNVCSEGPAADAGDAAVADAEPQRQGLRLRAEGRRHSRDRRSRCRGRTPAVRFWSRNGNEKTAQFPDIVEAIGTWLKKIKAPVVLDGEIVALDEDMRPASFQRLQHRIHVTVPGFNSKKQILPPQEQPAAFIAFDLLRDGDDDLRDLPLIERRKRLEALFKKHTLAVIRPGAHHRAISRRRHRAARAGEGRELGRLDGQAGAVAVSHRETQPGVDEIQAEQAGRVRRRAAGRIPAARARISDR